MSTRRAILQDYVRQGTWVDVRVRNGELLRGVVLVEVDDDCLYYRFGDGRPGGFVELAEVTRCMGAEAPPARIEPANPVGSGGQAVGHGNHPRHAVPVPVVEVKPPPPLAEVAVPAADIPPPTPIRQNEVATASQAPAAPPSDVAAPPADKLLADWRLRLLVCKVPGPVRERPEFTTWPSEAVLSPREAKQAWTNGEDTYKAGKYEAALRQFRSVFASFPREHSVAYNAACCAKLLRRWEDVATLLVEPVEAGYERGALLLLQATLHLGFDAGLLDLARWRASRALPTDALVFLLLLATTRGDEEARRLVSAMLVERHDLTDAHREAIHAAIGAMPSGESPAGPGLRQRVTALGGEVKKPAPRPIAKVETQTRKAPAGLPTGSGPYAEAKRAHAQADLSGAEKLFRQAIASGDNFEVAVKDLVSLLQQSKRQAEAVDLLKGYLPRLTNRLSALNVLAALYQDLQRYDAAQGILDEIFKLTKGASIYTVHQRKAYCYFKAGRYDEAERHLRIIVDALPTNAIATRWLAALDEARQSGSYQQAEAAFVLDTVAAFFGDFTPFAQESIRLSEYEGLKVSIIEAGVFTLQDVQYLEGRAKDEGTQRPKDRGRFYLSAARVLSEIAPEETHKIRDYLRRAFSSMGLSAVFERKPWDVARTYFCEAFAASISGPGHEDQETMSRFILTVLGDRALVITPPKNLHDALVRLGRAEQVNERFFELVVYASLFSSSYAETLLRAVFRDTVLRPAALEFLAHRGVTIGNGRDNDAAFLRLWTSQQTALSNMFRHTQERLAAAMSRLRPSVDAFQDVGQDIRQLDTSLFFELDQERLRRLFLVLHNCATYFEPTPYEARESLKALIETEVAAFTAEIDEGPTQLSRLSFRPLVLRARDVVIEHFQALELSSTPEITMGLAVETYYQKEDAKVHLQVALSNKHMASPASGICLSLRPAPEYYTSPSVVNVAGVLRGGATHTVHIPIEVTHRALTEEVFPIEIEGTYRLRDGTECRIGREPFSVHLNPPSAWEPVDNPYTQARGGGVKVPGMFYGRETLINWLHTTLTAPDAPGKCIVLYGQKRVGKTSVLEHLQKRLAWPVLPVHFSIGDIIDGMSQGLILWKILHELARAVEGAGDRGLPPVTVPSYSGMKDHPLVTFYEVLDGFVDECRRRPHLRDLRLCLLLDEFAYIYKKIQEKELKPEFMMLWKALLQKGYFTAFLVGHDVMPDFMDRFANELAVAHQYRCDYLDEDAARALAEEPILIGGRGGVSRYQGDALKDLINLTSCNPFYIQIFCDLLVKYINRERTPKVTSADIERVRDLAVQTGNERMVYKDFENLLTPGDEIPGVVTASDALQVLKRVAKMTDRGGCRLSDVLDLTTSRRPEEILANLLKRDVLEISRGETYTIKVGLFRDWLNANPHIEVPR